MSASIDRSIRQAENINRLGEVDAARAVIEKEMTSAKQPSFKGNGRAVCSYFAI